MEWWRASRTARRAGLAVLLVLAADPARAATPPLPGVPRIEVVASPDAVATAQLVQITVTYHDLVSDGRFAIWFGDGTSEGGGWYGGSLCDPLPSAASTQVERFRHAYRRPGAYQILVTFQADCGVAGGLGPVYAGSAIVRVVPGAEPSNGPEPPTADAMVFEPPARSPRSVHADVAVGDADGFLTRATYDWGDRSPPEVHTVPLADCTDPPAALHWPRSRHEHRLAHRYRRPGRYRLTLTVTSSGCDGADLQVRRVTRVLVVR